MKRSKVALVLAGGGITGAVYEVGALRAINNILRDLTVNDFDTYVGTSAGALICALIANGFSPEEIIQTLDNRHPEIGGVNVRDIFRADVAEYLRSLLNIPRALWRLGAASLKHPLNIALSDIVWELARVLPAGLYDSEALERYVRRILEMPGRCNRFDFLHKELFIVATELDTGARAVFGQGGKGIVPISRAVAASSAIPVIYRPVRIFGKDYVDGGLHGTASLDLAIEAGAKLVICINSMVPLNAERVFPNQHYMRSHGIQAIVNQTVRTLLHSTLRYHIKNLKAKYPDVDIILIQPEWDDERMFSHYPMHFGSRLALAEHGFSTVTNGLMQRLDYYQQILDRHGIALKPSIVERKFGARQLAGQDREQRTIEQRLLLVNSAVSQQSGNGEISFDLQSSLTRLEQNLSRLERLLEKSH
ncbi:patatin-like phospholipase family protein [Caldilinea sp.]|uniref:patatin-like phospholipase family protein n=1 Tax=Caldilinea sp. TaxID=2293560 RepID=UPI0021DCA29E|nr:patatin-like phospholipase family protein [Caldilinea sp.]GIV67476.1 MAG: patatin family protein [Caldilinea sp.]